MGKETINQNTIKMDDSKLYLIGSFYIPFENYMAEMIARDDCEGLEQFVRENGSLLEFPKLHPIDIYRLSDEAIEEWKKHASGLLTLKEIRNVGNNVEHLIDLFTALLKLIVKIQDSSNQSYTTTYHRLEAIEELIKKPSTPWYEKILQSIKKAFRGRRDD